VTVGIFGTVNRPSVEWCEGNRPPLTPPTGGYALAAPGRPAEGGDYAELPVMTPILCKIASADVEMGKPYTDASGKMGEPKQQVKVILDALSYVDDEGETVTLDDSRIWYYAGFSLHEKSKLRPLAQIVMPEGISEEDLFDTFDTDMLVGKKLYVLGEYKPGDTDRQYIKVKGFKRFKKAGAKAAEPAVERPVAKAKAKPAPEPDDDDEDLDV
jgi:hypothetical protein